MDMNSLNSEEDMKCQRNTPVQGRNFEDDFDEDSTSFRNDDGKKNCHSKIEKRRRDKINLYITELARILPMSPCIRSRRLDKLSVLKMTVQYMESMQSTANSYTEGRYKHSLMSDKDLSNLINRVADGFVFAVSCHGGEIIYMSKSVTQVLSYSPEELVRSNLFDYVHPKDVSKLKEQLFCSDVWYKDSNATVTPKMCSGARRSFFCRMKHKEQLTGKNEADSITGSKNRPPDQSNNRADNFYDSQYSVIHCTGYLKPWKQNKCENLSGKNLDLEDEGDDVRGTYNSANDVSCLVAFGRVVDTSISSSNLSDTVTPSQFTFKITVDGKFLSVDHNATAILGFLPKDLLGTSMFEYFHPDDIPRLIKVHKAALKECSPKSTEVYKFRTKDNTYIHLRSEWKSFRNPWTKEIDFITAKNNMTRPKPECNKESQCSSHGLQSQSSIFKEQQMFERQYLQSGVITFENHINSHLEACKYGNYVANTYLDKKKEVIDIESSPILAQHDLTEEASNEESLRSTMAVFNDPCSSSMDGTYGSTYAMSANSVAQDNVTLPSTASTYGQPAENVLSDVITSPLQPCSGSDTNDEVETAMLMNMLEAEAGLGGPVDHSGFPWPLP